MAIRNITVGIDVGTYATRVVVAEYKKGEKIPQILGTGMSVSNGLRHGYIINSDEAVKSIRRAVADAEKNAGIKIKRAALSIGGVSVGSALSVGSTIISKADTEVTSLDIAKAVKEAEDNLSLANKKIIETIPVAYKLDGKEITGRPEGMHGIKLEVRVLFITCLEQHFDDLVEAATDAGIEVVDVVPSPLAASAIALSDRQKSVGSILVNIGAETVSIAVFENGHAISLHIFSIGSTDITNDIALGLKVPLDEAEGIKIGSVMGNYPKKKLDEIIEARLSDIFELIDNHLKKIKRSELLPAGIIITGGGAQIAMIDEMAKSFLKLPARIGVAEFFGNAKSKIRDSSWFVATGLCVHDSHRNMGGSESGFGKEIKNFFKNIGKQLLP